MGIGVGILLIVVGAILTFAVNATVAGLNLDAVGWILMLAGAAGLILFFVVRNRRRTTRSVMADPRSYDNTDPPLV
jgi:hypothetical protein